LNRSPGIDEVRDVCPGETDAVYAALARAFEDDPVTEFLFPDPASRVAGLLGFYRMLVPTITSHGRLLTDGEVCGGALWQAPSPPRPRLRTTLGMMLRSALVLRGRTRAGLTLGRMLESVHEPRPHWYLAILGTEPAAQGRGIGSALMAPVLAQCDREGQLAYLESSKAANVPFYERHGFEVMQEVQVPDGPVLWSMLREPCVGGAGS
jgi:GNAT superfamily N-acetyltransferase